MVLAKHEVNSLLDTIQKQQQQFSELPDQLPLDPTIPITFTRVSQTFISLNFIFGWDSILECLLSTPAHFLYTIVVDKTF